MVGQALTMSLASQLKSDLREHELNGRLMLLFGPETASEHASMGVTSAIFTVISILLGWEAPHTIREEKKRIFKERSKSPVRLMVRIAGSQPAGRSSILLRGIKAGS